MDRAVIVLPDPLRIDGHIVEITTKTLEGLTLLAREWPGEMVVVARQAPFSRSPAWTAVPRQDLPFDLEISNAPRDSHALRAAAVMQAFHAPEDLGIVDVAGRRLVWIGEFPVRERIRVGTMSGSVVDKARATAGWLRKEPALRRAVAQAGGFQANGYPAWDSYAKLSDKRLLYFDTRVTASQMMSGTRARRPVPGTLRLGFSGRHESVKGPLYAVAAYRKLRDAGADVSLDVFGEGSQTHQIARELSGDARATIHGVVPYADRWVDQVRDDVDLMLLPHTQGDPAGTYLEAAALGVPVLGFANAALSPLVKRHGIGWTVRPHDVDAMAEKVVELLSDGVEMARAGREGISFMKEHTAEKEFRRRVQHLREVAQV